MIAGMKLESYYVRNGYKNELRFRCVDEQTGNILDDAQGYGYKTAQNAYRAFGYKKNHRNKNGKIRKAKKNYTDEELENQAYGAKLKMQEIAYQEHLKELKNKAN